VKKLFLLAIAVLALAVVVSGTLSVRFSAGLDQVWSAQSTGDSLGKTVAVLLPSERDPFWDNLVSALRKGGARSHLNFEVSRYSSTGENAREVLEKTALSQVDALLCLPPDAVDVSAVVNTAEGRGLPVLLLENDLPNSRRRVFLGVGSFQMGHEVGQLIRRQVSGARTGGVLLSQSNLERQTVRNSLFLNGLNQGLASRAGEFALQEVISPPGRFAGEELVWSLLRVESPVQVLITTNPKDTMSALQTIVEANRVGKTRLVGVGEDAGLRQALEQGLISGLITRNADEWAATIESTLQRLLAGQSVSSYINLPVHALSAQGAPSAD
jgi:ribose transport system substrate-binding protein